MHYRPRKCVTFCLHEAAYVHISAHVRMVPELLAGTLLFCFVHASKGEHGVLWDLSDRSYRGYAWIR